MPDIRDLLAGGAAEPSRPPDYLDAGRQVGAQLRRRRLGGAAMLAALVVALLLAASTLPVDRSGSGSEVADGTPPTTELGDIELIGALRSFDACEDFLAYVDDQVTANTTEYGLPVSPPSDWDQVISFGPRDEGPDGGRSAPPIPSTTVPAAAAPNDVLPGQDPAMLTPYGPNGEEQYSTTNVQEEGVDEPDVVKTDGDRLYTLTDGTLTIVDISGDQPSVLGRLPMLDTTDQQLVLQGDRLLVLGRGYGQGYDVLPAGTAPPLPGQPPTTIWRDYYGGTEQTVIKEVDVSDPAEPSVVSTLRIPGRYLDARSTGGTARIAVTSQPTGLAFVYPTSDEATDAAETANQDIVRQSTIENWVPEMVVIAEDGAETKQPLVGCDQVRHPEQFSGASLLSLVSIGDDQPLGDASTTSVLADGQTVYASTENLYVTTNRYVVPDLLPQDPALPPDEPSDAYTTEIHQFGIADAGVPQYKASGEVRGHLLNQFSLSEHEGSLRVATTDGEPWQTGIESFVTVLKPNGPNLEQVGQVGELGRGQDIYAVRFLGDVGYVVTFEQKDPLYTVDLADPANPEVVGELEILGYSSYLHPVGEGRLLGIGQDADESGSLRGTAVSLFDVSDPAAPRRLQQYTLPGGESDAEIEHHAFMWWAPEELAVIPVVSGYDAQQFLYGAIGLDVGDDTISERGRVSHEGHFPEGRIERSVVVGDRLYTVSAAGVLASDLSTFEREAFAEFTPAP